MTGSRQMNNDGSVSMSLRELMRLEEERVDRERQDVRRRAEAEANARAEAERKARDAELAALYAEHARQHAEEERERELAARLDGIARAAVERARLEAQDAALLAQRSDQMRHAEELARLEQDVEKRRLRRVIWALVMASVTVVGAFSAFYVLKMRPEAERLRASTYAESRELAEAKAKAEQKSRDQQDKIDALRRDIEAQRSAPAPATPAKAPAAVVSAPPSRGVVPKKKDDGIYYAKKCNSDPLCIEK